MEKYKLDKIAIFLWFFSIIYAQADDFYKIEYSQSQILDIGIIDDYDTGLYDGTNTVTGSLLRHDYIFIYKKYFEYGYFLTSGNLSYTRNPGTSSYSDTDYPEINGSEVSNITNMKFSGFYTGLRTPWRGLFALGRLGLGKEEYTALIANSFEGLSYESSGIFLDAALGYKWQFYNSIDVGFTFGWSGIIHGVESDFSDQNIYAGLNMSINFKKLDITKINLPKINLEQPLPRKNNDNKPPTLKIDYPLLKQNIFRTEEPQLTIKGKASDQVGVAFIKINNKNVPLDANGSFFKRQRLKIGKNLITVKAIDINDNIRETEFYIIREEYFEDNFSDVDMPLVTKNDNKNGIAVVIGIEEYQYAPSVSFAYNDADIIREYLVTTFGFKRENIYYKTNNRATKGEFEKIFSKNGWLENHTNENSDIFIFYAGHGAPNIVTGDSYLVPYDIDPNYATTGYSLEELYNNLGNIRSRSITVILDACFSGGTRENQLLLSDARPVFIDFKSGNIPKKTMVFSAASGKEISSAYKQKSHGIFTYYFLKGLNGAADINKDKKITNLEMYKYLDEKVSNQARRIGREQNPQMLGSDKNRILLAY